MRAIACFFVLFSLVGILVVAAMALAAAAQDAALPTIAREVYGPRANVPVPAVPPVQVPAKTVIDPVVPAPAIAERVIRTPAAVVIERPVVRTEVVAPAAVVTWWDAFARNTYGFYEDGYLDDNWYYDYYELPRAARAVTVVERPTGGAALGHHTSWVYEPVAERGLFSW